MVEVERLGDHLHTRLQKAVGYHRGFGIAGDEEDLQAGPGFPRLIGELAAVHPGQADIGYQQIDPLAGSPDIEAGRPGMNGRQLADQARENRPRLKVLFITGYAESTVISDGFLQPGMEMITKPFDLDHLAHRIRAMVSH